MKYDVTFERVGRGHLVGQVQHFEAQDAEDLAEEVYAFIKGARVLMSNDFEVIVDLEKMRGSIEYGRFGEFAIKECAE